MFKTVPCEISGRSCLLHFSMGVLFDVQEKFGSAQAALDLIMDGGREGFEAVQWLALRMAREGEMARRAVGYEPQPLPDDGDVADLIGPREYTALRTAVIRACSLAFSREVESEDAETDLVILELAEKKTQPGS